MSASHFINEDNELRSGWKFGVFVMIYLLARFSCILILTEILRSWLARTDLFLARFRLIELGLNVIARFIPAVGATWFMGRFVDHRPTSSFVGFRGWQRNLATGILIGGGLLSFLMLGFVVAGTVRLEPAMRDLSLLVITIAVITLAAASEELLFRGYLLQSLATGIGRWPAALIMSGLFGMMHASNPNITNVWWIGIINTVVAGLMLSVAYFKARSLWLPYGIHVAWNAGLGIVLGFSLSGIELDSIWKSSVDSSATLTGGLYGPEGGIICTIVFLAGLFVMGFLPIRSAEARDIKE